MKKTFFKKIVIFLGILIGLVLIWNVGVLIVAKYNVSKARAAEMQSSDKEIADIISLFMSSGIVLERLGSSKVDVCYIDSEDAGWFASSWYQQCYLLYLEGFSTDLDELVLRTKLRTMLVGNTLFGEEYLYRGCDLYKDTVFKTTILFIPEQTASDGERPVFYNNCEIPDQVWGQGLAVVRVRFDPSKSKKRVFYSFDREAIDTSHAQIWIMIDKQYYRESLGCAIGLFCENPRYTPVTADWL